MPTRISPVPSSLGELMRFVEFWHAIAGRDPQWLYFDSKLVPYAELARINQRGIWFVTIRRRGAALLRSLQELPAHTWRQTTLDIPKRRHQHVRYVDETVTLRGYKGPIRQLALDGLGRSQCTLLVSNNFDTSARECDHTLCWTQQRGRQSGHQCQLSFISTVSPARCA